MKRPCVTMDEQAAFTGWRHVEIWRPGQRKRIKRRANRRERRAERQDNRRDSR
jgi:hypothetical protein